MKVVQAPDDRLRIKCKPIKKVTPELMQTIKEMVKLTKTFVDPEGVGLASTQIGNDQQYFVAKMDGEKFKPFFNPKILKYSKQVKLYFEGCLSLPDYYGEINRSTWIDVSYMDQNGKKVDERLKGVPAWIFQHEFDHINGKLFVDHVLEQKARFFRVTGQDQAGNEIFEELKLVD
jgi:peptide deformylase